MITTNSRSAALNRRPLPEGKFQPREAPSFQKIRCWGFIFRMLLLVGHLSGCFWEGESGLDPDFFNFFMTDAGSGIDASIGDGGTGMDADLVDFVNADATLEFDASIEDSGGEFSDTGPGADARSRPDASVEDSRGGSNDARSAVDATFDHDSGSEVDDAGSGID